MIMEKKLENNVTNACATCFHKSKLKRESDPSATWCLKLMMYITHPDFACMYHLEQDDKNRLPQALARGTGKSQR
jgi:hypothetical protein